MIVSLATTVMGCVWLPKNRAVFLCILKQQNKTQNIAKILN